ncbi:MAG: GIY-YIG nuclease family protein, partial [Coriobacteriales bacterium]|nr:GIY-YIG nuclease family protein [Coriobacteriales bacterium]
MDIRQQLESVPLEPGCYLWKDSSGAVLYVGKAKSLRSRMKQYVMGTDERAKIPRMMEQVASFDYLVCDNETEALVLEKTLIKQYSPPFNADFKDDKTYPFIAITHSDPFPAIKYTREHHRAGTRYFGPYTDSRAARDMIDALRRVVPLCSANCVEHKRLCRTSGSGETAASKPCFDYHVGLGPGPCCAAIGQEEYQENVRAAERFLAGHRKEFISKLDMDMRDAADELDFERAARIKRRIESIQALGEKQKAVSQSNLDADIIGFCREETITGVQVLVVREGSIIISNEFILDKGMDIAQDSLVETFMLRYNES